jgi:hypothetical protein
MLRIFVAFTLVCCAWPADAGVKYRSRDVMLIPVQPVFSLIGEEPSKEAGIALETALAEVGNFRTGVAKVGTKAAWVSGDRSAKKDARWIKEIDFAETNLRRNRPGLAIKGAQLVWRQMRFNAAQVRNPSTLCRTLLVFTEAHLQMGQRRPAKRRMRRLVASCSELYREGRGRAKPSKRFLALFAQTRAVLKMAAPGVLEVRSDTPGATVLLNATAVGTTPLRIEGIPPGEHFVAVVRDGSPTWGTTVKLGGRVVALHAPIGAKLAGPLGRLIDDLRNNRLTATGIAAARDLLKSGGGRARHIVFGGMIQKGSVVKMQLFVVNKRGRAMRLKVLETDSDFFGVSLELEPLVRQLRGPFRSKTIAEEVLFKGVERLKSQARVVTFSALSTPLGSFEEMLRDEDKEDDIADIKVPSKKTRRPVLRRPGKGPEPKELRASPAPRTFSDFKDENDK